MEGGETPKGGKQTSSESASKLSRRDFLKVAALSVAAYGGKKAIDKITGIPMGKEAENTRLSINLADFVKSVEEGKPEIVAIDFFKLKKNYPFLVDQKEGGYILKNKEEKLVELSLDDLGGKTIVFPKANEVAAAKSNVPTKEYQNGSGYGKVKVGLVLEGNFSVSFDRMFADKPTFSGKGLDRAIMVTGTDKRSVCHIENIKFEGLNDFLQVDGGQDIPAPAYISADNAALLVEGVDIFHTPQKPEDKDEVNSQLTRGIILNATHGGESIEKINYLEVKRSNIKGLLWDAIVANGESIINVEDCRLEQSEQYRLRRGAAVATTFNTNRGSITVNKSRIDYNKGVANFTDAENSSAFVNMTINESILSVTQWATVLKHSEKAKLINTFIDLSKETTQIIPEGVELTNWGDLPFAHIDIDDTEKGAEKVVDHVSFRLSKNTKENDKVLLLHVTGYQRAYDDPQGYIEDVFSKIGPLGFLDERNDGLLRLQRWFTTKKLMAVLKRAVSESGYYPTEVVLVYKNGNEGSIFDEWGVIVDDLRGGIPNRKPSKIFYYQPLEEERGYQENPRY